MTWTCPHTHTIFSEYSTIVCEDCGLERPYLCNVMDYKTSLTSAPLNRCYNRYDRWNCLVKKICGIHVGPPISDPVWGYLESKKPFSSTQAILKCLRRAPIKNKHYPSLHAFTKNFCTNYTKPRIPSNQVHHKLCKYFKHILFIWTTIKVPDQALFFSYNWLIEQGLAFFNFTEYMPFVKRLKCTNRRNKYVNFLIKLYGTHVAMKNRAPLNSHPQNELFQRLIRHNRLSKPPNLFARIVETRHSEPKADSTRDLGYRLLKSLGTLGRI